MMQRHAVNSCDHACVQCCQQVSLYVTLLLDIITSQARNVTFLAAPLQRNIEMKTYCTPCLAAPAL